MKSGLKPVDVTDVMRSVNALLMDKGNSAGYPESQSEEIRLPRIHASFHLPEKDSYEPEELLKYHDGEFIQAAYLAILRRMPDPNGMEHFLRLMREGRYSKKEILGILMASGEAKQYRVRIKGVRLHYWFAAIKRIPVLGHVAEWLVTILTLPRKLRHMQEMIHYLIAQSKILTYHYNDLNGILESFLRHQKERIDELDKNQKKIESELDLERIQKQEKEKQDSFSLQFYSDFQDRFRGTREDIKNRLSVYLPYLKKAGEPGVPLRILDLGSGRGEWLELMQEQGHRAVGVDKNLTFVYSCRAIGLDVVYADLLEYMQDQPDQQFDVITGFHIIEHLPFSMLLQVFDECFRLLKPNGLLIFETPNPENILVSTLGFHTDHTHQKPLVPELMEFVSKQKGFSHTEILRLHKRNEPEYTGNPYVDEVLYKMNMEQDYSIIAQK